MIYDVSDTINNVRGGLAGQSDVSFGPGAGAVLVSRLPPGQSVLYPAPSPVIEGYSLAGGLEVSCFDSCGEIFSLNVCSNSDCGHQLVRHCSCHRVECPVCSKDWQRRAAERASRRVAASAMLEQKWSHHVEHLVLSPPASEYAAFYVVGDDARAPLRKKAISYLKELGVEGGTVIFHALRRGKGGAGWYFSPHFHVVGFGRRTEGSESFHRRTGWVFKAVSRAPRVKRYRDIYDAVCKYAYGVVAYALDHVAYWSDRSTGARLDHGDLLSYFGCMSTRAMKVDNTIVEKEHVRCSECESPMYEVERHHYEPCHWVDDIERPTIRRKKYCKFRSLVHDREFEEPGYRIRRKRLEQLGWCPTNFTGYIAWKDNENGQTDSAKSV